MPDPISEARPVDAVTRLIEEGLIGLSQAARLTGTFRQGRPTHPSTLARWAMRGVTLPDGRVLKLESLRLNGRLCTSKQAITRFILAQQVPTSPGDTPDPPRSPAAGRRASEDAAAQLKEDGRLTIP
jgi:hypothetical protein